MEEKTMRIQDNWLLQSLLNPKALTPQQEEAINLNGGKIDLEKFLTDKSKPQAPKPSK
jgi:hypothetical protein